MENATATGQVASLPEMRLNICGLVAHAADEIAVNARDAGWQHVWVEDCEYEEYLEQARTMHR
eukprot:1217369-Amphidinium_carterae.1